MVSHGPRFFEVRNYIKEAWPRSTVLENVKGLDREDPQATEEGSTCFDRIMEELRSIGNYEVNVVELSPVDLDYRVLQGRYWFILVRQDSAEPEHVEANH